MLQNISRQRQLAPGQLGMLSLDSFLKESIHSDVGKFSLIQGKCSETLSLWILPVKVFLGWGVFPGIRSP
jgi:hypothetical protein